MSEVKPVDRLTVADLAAEPVWRYTNANESDLDETAVTPVKRKPVSSLSNKVVGTRVRLANGQEAWALLSNVEADSPEMTEQFLSVSVEKDGRWFHLARYHDVDIGRNGPDQLAAFLGLPLSAVFPIVYDIRPYAKGNADALAGVIEAEPVRRLSDDDLMMLIVRSTAPKD